MMQTSRIVLGALLLSLPLIAAPRPAAAWPWNQSAAAKSQRLERIARNAGVTNSVSGSDRARFDAIMSGARQLAKGESVTVRLRNTGLLARFQGRPMAAEIRARGTNELLGTLSSRTYITGTSLSAFVTQRAGELRLAQPNKPLQSVSFGTGEMFGDL